MDSGAGREASPGFRAPPRLVLLPLEPEPAEDAEVTWLAGALEARLGTRVTVAPPEPAHPDWRPDDGAQLDSSAIVDALIERYPEAAEGPWILGLTAADLRGGGRTFTFGEAARGGGWAVVGTARFGARGDPHFRQRLLREALHELGHLAGLDHCTDPACLMAASATVAQVDGKMDVLCEGCRSTIAGDGTCYSTGK